VPFFYFLPIFISPPSSARSSTSKELLALVCDPPNELHNITRDCRRYVHRARGVAVSDSLKSHLIAAPCVHCKRSRQNLAQLDYVAKRTNEIRALLVTCFPHALLINMILRCSWRCSEMKFRRSATYVNQFPVKPVARHRELPFANLFASLRYIRIHEFNAESYSHSKPSGRFCVKYQNLCNRQKQSALHRIMQWKRDTPVANVLFQLSLYICGGKASFRLPRSKIIKKSIKVL